LLQKKSDIWAFGMILYQIITGRKPFGDRNDPEVRRAIIASEKVSLPPGDDLIYAIYDNCVSPAPEERPEFFHVVQALMDDPNPLFEGQDPDEFTEYKNRVFRETVQSEEAEQVFAAAEDLLISRPGDRPAVPLDERRRLALAGDVKSQLTLGKMYVNNEKNYDEAAVFYRMAAQARNPHGLYGWGLLLLLGRGVPQDIVRAAQCFQEAADAGVMSAVEEYARALHLGRGVEQNLPEALQKYKLGADHGRQKCQYYYARMRLNGEGGPKNVPEALRYYGMAHSASYVAATTDLASLYSSGTGVAKDVNKAVAIYQEAIRLGCVRAKALLAVLYHTEPSIRNPRIAAQLFAEAAPVDDFAKVWLASYVKDGKGEIPPDPRRAMQLYEEVANKDIPGKDPMVVGRARNNYAAMCLDGVGGLRDLDTAYHYYALAAQVGVVPAGLKYAEMTADPSLRLVTDRARAIGYLNEIISGALPGPDATVTPAHRDRARELLARLS
jgi:TPR repeat protein